jgi:hypothetical protein
MRRSKTMIKSIFAPAVAWGALAILTSGEVHAALPLAHPGPTVNDYTAAQSQRAEVAARGAGFGELEIVMVQVGNFFLNGQRQGQSYSLTVTRDGKVYSSSGSAAAKS